MAEYPGLDHVLGEFFEAAGNLKIRAKDGLNVSEMIDSIPDPEVKKYVGGILQAVQQLPGEVQKVVSGGPWEMMRLAQSVAGKAMMLFK